MMNEWMNGGRTVLNGIFDSELYRISFSSSSSSSLQKLLYLMADGRCGECASEYEYEYEIRSDKCMRDAD